MLGDNHIVPSRYASKRVCMILPHAVSLQPSELLTATIYYFDYFAVGWRWEGGGYAHDLTASVAVRCNILYV